MPREITQRRRAAMCSLYMFVQFWHIWHMHVRRKLHIRWYMLITLLAYRFIQAKLHTLDAYLVVLFVVLLYAKFNRVYNRKMGVGR